MKLITCSNCGEFFKKTDHQCPHCKEDQRLLYKQKNIKMTTSTILLGLALTGCGDKSEDTSSTEPTSEPTSEPAVEPPYGVPDTGQSNEEE